MKKLYRVTPNERDWRFNEEVSCLAENKEEAIELTKTYFDYYQLPLRVEELNMDESRIVTVCQEEKKVEWYNLGFLKKIEETGDCCCRS